MGHQFMSCACALFLHFLAAPGLPGHMQLGLEQNTSTPAAPTCLDSHPCNPHPGDSRPSCMTRPPAACRTRNNTSKSGHVRGHITRGGFKPTMLDMTSCCLSLLAAAAALLKSSYAPPAVGSTCLNDGVQECWRPLTKGSKRTDAVNFRSNACMCVANVRLASTLAKMCDIIQHLCLNYKSRHIKGTWCVPGTNSALKPHCSIFRLVWPPLVSAEANKTHLVLVASCGNEELALEPVLKGTYEPHYACVSHTAFDSTPSPDPNRCLQRSSLKHCTATADRLC
eukprot:1156352-Pelagomonas_calceolata.AAC.5